MRCLIWIFAIWLAVTAASDDQVTELPTPVPLAGAKLMTTADQPLNKRETTALNSEAMPPPKEASSSESSEEKPTVVTTEGVAVVPSEQVALAAGAPVVKSIKKREAPVEPLDSEAMPPPKEASSSSESSEEKTTAIPVEGIPVTATGIPIVKGTRKRSPQEGRMRRSPTDTPNVGASEYPVTEPPKAAVTPQGVEEDDGLPDLGLGTRKRRATEEFRDPVTEPPKNAVTPEGVEKDDGLPEIGLGSRKRRDSDFVGDKDYPVTEPPKSAVTPMGVEEESILPDLGIGSRKIREVSSRARRYA